MMLLITEQFNINKNKIFVNKAVAALIRHIHCRLEGNSGNDRKCQKFHLVHCVSYDKLLTYYDKCLEQSTEATVISSVRCVFVGFFHHEDQTIITTIWCHLHLLQLTAPLVISYLEARLPE